MSLGYVVEIHVAAKAIPDEVIQPERLAQGIRVLLVQPRSESGLLLVLECPRATDRWHVRIDSLEDRVEHLHDLLAARAATAPEDWN